jgi:hypothetical protein
MPGMFGCQDKELIGLTGETMDIKPGTIGLTKERELGLTGETTDIELGIDG